MAGDEKVGRWDWFVKISECCTTDILSFVVFNHDGTFLDYVTCSDYVMISNLLCAKKSLTLSGRNLDVEKWLLRSKHGPYNMGDRDTKSIPCPFVTI